MSGFTIEIFVLSVLMCLLCPMPENSEQIVKIKTCLIKMNSPYRDDIIARRFETLNGSNGKG